MEMLVVIVLIGVLTAVALPRFLGSAVDANRALNNFTVATLNAAEEAALSNARIPGALVTVSSLTANAASYSGTTAYILNIDNNATITTNNYLGFNSTGTIIIGGSKGVYANTPTSSTLLTSGTATLGYAAITGATYATGCNNLFNVLMGDNSVQSSTAATTAYTSLTASPGTLAFVNGISAATAITTAMINANSAWAATSFTPAANRGCAYLLNTKDSIKFYVIYDGISGIFYAAEI